MSGVPDGGPTVDDAGPAGPADTGRAAKKEHADGGRTAKKEQTTRPDPEQVEKVSYHFYSDVHAPGGGFGPGYGPMSSTDGSRRKATGRLRDTDVDAITGRYAEPGIFTTAVDRLLAERVAVLEGPAGSGRRAGAITLLRRATPGPLVVLSPMTTLRDLAERDYTRGYGYLVIDRRAEARTADVDFTWANVVDRVRDHGAHLVVTCSVMESRAVTKAVVWERPPVPDVLHAHLSDWPDPAKDDLVGKAALEVPPECPLARLAELAGLLRDCRDVRTALDRLDAGAGAEVREWFAAPRTAREIAEVTTLAFAHSTDVRTYETLLRSLEGHLERQIPRPRGKAPVVKDEDPFLTRQRRSGAAGLFGLKEVPFRAGTSQVMEFKEFAYQRHVLQILWETRSIAFWDGVRGWVDDIVRGDPEIVIAAGLAWLACTSFDEVETSYLEPWSYGKLGWPGQVTATYVLWMMCQDDTLAPLALQTAVRWASEPDIDRRWTALVTFGGELGIAYPTDAVKRLWQLISQSDDLWEAGCAVLAGLFVTLVDETPSAVQVLNLLELKLAAFGTAPDRARPHQNARDLRERVMESALAVVTLPSVKTRRPAVFDFLHAHPERRDLVAGIWAGLLRYRPLRRQALISLRRGLHALRDLSTSPQDDARLFGIALSRALPERERTLFKRDFTTVDEQLRRGQTESPAAVLIACLDAILVHHQPGGQRS
jgi:hypothetical protein